jgi:hypothetical protein
MRHELVHLLGNTMNYRKQQRRGMTAVLAMLYLVLFSSLAIGFYTATVTSAQMSSTDQQIGKAYMATESGMDFMRYQLSRVSIPPGTPTTQVINALYTNLQSQLVGTGNMAGQNISLNGNTISIPSSSTGTIKLDSKNDSRFRATITDWAGEIVVKVDGLNGTAGIRRAFSMDFSRTKHTGNIFTFAVASKGQIVASKGAVTSVPGVDPAIATMMSAQPVAGAVTVSGGTIGGDLGVVAGGSASVTSGSVGGSSIPSVILHDHVFQVDPPEFPTLDTSVYRRYAVNNYDSHAGTQSNIYVPPNTNPTFNGNNTVQGIMYIDTPNKVTFNGSFNLKGFIVMATGSSTTDELKFSGNLTMSALPNQPQFDSLRSVSGVAIMAPNAAVNMGGSSSSLKGNIMSNTFNFTGAGDVQIDQGSLITYSPNANAAVFNSSKSIRFSSTGANNQPNTGVTYSTYYTPNAGSYQEVMP